MHMRHLLASSSFILFMLPLGADAKLASQGASSEASFTAQGPAGLRIVGKTGGVIMTEDAGSAHVRVPLGAMTTGIALRDRHMRERLQVDKYPNAELVVPVSALKVAGGQTANGTMTIHGQSRPVVVRYDAKRDGNVIHVAGTTAVNMNDYGIETPSYLGVTVKPDVQIAVHFDAVDSAP